VIQCRFSTNRFWLHKSWVKRHLPILSAAK
jgi:lysophospholipid acyltransferase (LPLAT)-like uncharacterized protein